MNRMHWDKIVRVLPSVTALAINAIAPAGSYTALKHLQDARVVAAVSDPGMLGVMDLYLQVAVVFSTLLVTTVAAIASGGGSPVKRVWAAIGGVGALMCFVWLFAIDGFAKVNVDLYIRPSSSGVLRWPPWESVLTKVRLWLGIYSAILFLIELDVLGSLRKRNKKAESS